MELVSQDGETVTIRMSNKEFSVIGSVLESVYANYDSQDQTILMKSFEDVRHPFPAPSEAPARLCVL